MNIIPQTHKLELLLKRHQLLTLSEAQPRMAIECKEGVVWVTRSGDLQDYVLRPGRHYTSGSKGRVVIEAMDDACVDIEERNS